MYVACLSMHVFCVCMYACVYVCMHVCVYACMCVCMYVYCAVVYACMRVCIYTCAVVHVCMQVCMYICCAFVEGAVKQMVRQGNLVWHCVKVIPVFVDTFRWVCFVMCMFRWVCFVACVAFCSNNWYASLGMHVSFAWFPIPDFTRPTHTGFVGALFLEGYLHGGAVSTS
jgi:hypothetical protein